MPGGDAPEPIAHEARGLACAGLTVGYSARHAVLHEVSVRFTDGRLTALLGPNGCGKSTLLKAMLGLLRPLHGRVTLDGRSIHAMPRREVARRLAWLPQHGSCPDHLCVADLVALGGFARQSVFRGPSQRDRELFERALRTVGLAEQVQTPVNRLSGGQRQRAWLALALAQDAHIMLLDEPVNHLDLKHQYAVLEVVRRLVHEQGRTVVAVLHDLNLAAAFADEVLILKEGRVHAGGSTRQVMRADTLERAFDLPIRVHALDGGMVCLPQRMAFGKAGAS